jgi:hypothetical protein
LIYKGLCGKRWHVTDRKGQEIYYECPNRYCRMTAGYYKMQLEELIKICKECLREESHE